MSVDPSLCMIYEGIGPYNAIAKIAMAGVWGALDAGWRVTVVAKRLHESLHAHVDWRRLYVPPRFHLLQWLTARHFIKRAMGDNGFDIIHVHQPQVADLADVFQCHFLTRASYERRCLDTRRDLRGRFHRLQQQGVVYAEDYFCRQVNHNTLMLFAGEMMRSEFARLYGCPRKEEIVPVPIPDYDRPGDLERSEARRAFAGDFPGPIVGYLGGIQERKGYRRLIEALKPCPDVFLLLGGIHSERLKLPEMQGRYRTLGAVHDIRQFYAACDVMAVPSHFEPTGLVAFEAASMGVPVIATKEVGALSILLLYGAGERWNPDDGLGALVHRMSVERERYQAGARRMANELSVSRFTKQLLNIYDQVRHERHRSESSG